MSQFSIVNPGKISAFRQTPDGISGSSQNSFFELSLFTKGIVNVRFSRSETFNRLSYAVIREPAGGLSDVSDLPECVVLSSELVSVRLWKDDC